MERGLEEALGRVQERSGLGATGVVDDDVDPSELTDGGVDDPREVGGVAHVGRNHESSSAQGRDFGGHPLQLVCGAGGDHHVGALLGQGQGRRSAYAASSARDDGDLIIEAKSVEKHGR